MLFPCFIKSIVTNLDLHLTSEEIVFASSVNRSSKLKNGRRFREIHLLDVDQLMSIRAILPGLHLRKRYMRFSRRKDLET
jgi:hypothetical protein